MFISLAHYVSQLRRDFTDYCARRLQEVGLTQGQLYFVLYIGKHSGCTPSELGRALQMDSGHVARTLSKLEQGGFLRQESDPSDRRAHLLYLEERGQRAFALSHELFGAWDEEVLHGFSAEERRQLLALLHRLVYPNATSAKGGDAR